MIGVFDSGFGGLGVALAIRRRLPDADLLYVGDRARAPYGRQSLADVQGFSEEITAYLTDRGAETIVIACNTASAAALHHLRRRHPATRFVGMEPAVKPAVAATGSGVVGVLATPATFQSELFASVVARFAPTVRVVEQVCPGWVEQVESGDLDGPETEAIVRACLDPVLATAADVLVLACTHYSFLRPMIERIAGLAVTVVDPADAVARQTARVASPGGSGTTLIELTGDDEQAGELIERLTGLALPTRAVVLAA